jgi:hypothetical protein
MNETAGVSAFTYCRCGVLDDLDEDGLCRVCAAAPHHPECLCDECDEYWTAVQEGVDPKTWRPA